MSNQRVSIDGLADAINDGLKEYATLATEGMKAAVHKSARLSKTASLLVLQWIPVRYAKSWKKRRRRAAHRWR